MKKSWKIAVAKVLLAGAVSAGCAMPAYAAPPAAGLTAEQLTGAAQPPKSASWFPKIELPKFPRSSRKSSSHSDNAATNESGGPNSKSQNKGDPIALARLFEKRGQTETAVNLYQQELARDPRNGLIHHRLAVIFAKENQWDKARSHFAAAQELMPGNTELLSDLGYALYLQHQLPEAEAALRASLAASPKNSAAHNNLGIVLGVQGKFDESLAEFRQVGSDAEAYANLAYVHTQLGDIEQAMLHLQRALTSDPKLRPAAVALLQLNELKLRFKAQQRDALLVQGKKESEQSQLASQAGEQRDVATVASLTPLPPLAASAARAPLDAPRSGPAPIVTRSEALAARPAVSSEEPQRVFKAELPATAQPEPRTVAIGKTPTTERLPPVPVSLLSPANAAAKPPSEAPLSQSIPPARMSQPAKVVSAASIAPVLRPTTAQLPERNPVRSKSIAPAAKFESPSPEVQAAPQRSLAPVVERTSIAQAPAYVPARPLPAVSLSQRILARAKPASSSAAQEPSLAPIVNRTSIAGRPLDRMTTNAAPSLLNRGLMPVPPAMADTQPLQPAPIVTPEMLSPVPVISPSSRMQAIREDEYQAAELAYNKPFVNPFVKSPAAATGARPMAPSASQSDHQIAPVVPASFVQQTTLAELNGVPATEFAAASQVNDRPPVASPIDGNPIFASSTTLPGPEDMLSPEFRLLQLPTSRLHPTAQPTWSAHSAPVRGPADQPSVSHAHYFDWSGKVSQEPGLR